MAFKGTTGARSLEPDPINHFSIGRREMLQFGYRDIPFKFVSQIEPHRFFRSPGQLDLISSSQKNVQLGGLDISFAGLRLPALHAITISKVTARDQKDRQHNQQAERVVLPGPAGKRPEEDVFNSDQKRLHSTTVCLEWAVDSG